MLINANLKIMLIPFVVDSIRCGILKTQERKIFVNEVVFQKSRLSLIVTENVDCTENRCDIKKVSDSNVELKAIFTNNSSSESESTPTELDNCIITLKKFHFNFDIQPQLEIFIVIDEYNIDSYIGRFRPKSTIVNILNNIEIVNFFESVKAASYNSALYNTSRVELDYNDMRIANKLIDVSEESLSESDISLFEDNFSLNSADNDANFCLLSSEFDVNLFIISPADQVTLQQRGAINL